MGNCCSCDIESYGIESYGYNKDLHRTNYGSSRTTEKELVIEPVLQKHYYLYS